MEDFAERLDLTAASAELDALLAAFAAGHQPYPWLRAALETLRVSPTAAREAAEAAGWMAMLVTDGPTQAVYANRVDTPETGVRGDWRSGRLIGAQASQGARFWILRAEGMGETTWSVDAGEGAGTEQARHRAVEGRVAQGISAALPRLGALPGWACSACGWRNDEARPICELCEAPRVGAASARPVAPASALPHARESQTLELPDALSDLVEQALDEAREAARDASRSPAPPAPAPAPSPPFLMLIDAVFEIPGHGAVASGVVRRGRLRGGEPLEVVGSVVRPGRARTIERDQRAAPEANSGDTIGILLDGVSRADLAPGMVLAAPGSIRPALEFDAQVTHVAGPTPMPGRTYQVLVWSIAVNGWVVANNGYTASNALAIRVRLAQAVPIEPGLGIALRENGIVIAVGPVTRVG